MSISRQVHKDFNLNERKTQRQVDAENKEYNDWNNQSRNEGILFRLFSTSAGPWEGTAAIPESQAKLEKR